MNPEVHVEMARGLRQIFKSGLRVDRIICFDRLLAPPVRLKDQIASHGKSSGVEISPPRINPAPYAIFASERHMLANLSLSVSVSLPDIVRAE